MKKVTVLVPCYNEEEALPLFYERICGTISSLDGYEWELATYEDGTNIGNSLGETTMIRIPEELQDRQIRYIRLTIANKAVGTLDGRTTYSLRLGSFIPY